MGGSCTGILGRDVCQGQPPRPSDMRMGGAVVLAWRHRNSATGRMMMEILSHCSKGPLAPTDPVLGHGDLGWCGGRSFADHAPVLVVGPDPVRVGFPGLDIGVDVCPVAVSRVRHKGGELTPTHLFADPVPLNSRGADNLPIKGLCQWRRDIGPLGRPDRVPLT